MTKRKSKTVDAPIVYNEGEQRFVMFGWCSTGHHEGCVVEFPGHKCSCECHKESDEKENSS